MGFLSCLYRSIYTSGSHGDIRLCNVYRSDSMQSDYVRLRSGCYCYASNRTILYILCLYIAIIWK